MKTLIVKIKKSLVFLFLMMFLTGVCFTIDSALVKSAMAQDDGSEQYTEEMAEPADEPYQPEPTEEAYPTEEYDENQAE